jgi:hypothetical protein
LLLELRAALFGPQLLCHLCCPDCRERLELTFDSRELALPEPAEQAENLSICVGDHAVAFRLAAAGDLTIAGRESNAEDAKRVLLRRCITAATHGDVPIDPAELPAEVVDTLERRMAAADEAGDIRLDVSCPQCSWHWQEAFDIAAFLWSELGAWAQRLLSDVHTLAWAYGWREEDIIAMSPWRRQWYLQSMAP